MSENRKLINSANESCKIKEVSKVNLIRDIFHWHDLNEFRKNQNFTLFEVSKFLDYL